MEDMKLSEVSTETLEVYLAKRKEEEDNELKDWRDAFLEHHDYTTFKINKKEYAGADTLQITRCGDCTYPQLLLKYVLQFKNGGFWFEEADSKLYIVTEGFGSDGDATYEGAKEFIEESK